MTIAKQKHAIFCHKELKYNPKEFKKTWSVFFLKVDSYREIQNL